MKHFTKSKKNLFEEFETTSTGLTDDEVKKRRKKYGENRFVEKEKDGLIKIFFDQFKDSLVIILLVAAIISFFSGNKESSFVIVLVLILNSILGAYQTVKAQKSLDSLKKMSSPKCKVIRDHEQLELDSSEVVPGDIVIIEAGDIVPADGRIIENFSLLVNENSLTGESNSIEKTDEVLQYEDLALGDQVNMVFSGSLVNYGRAKILITETGMSTQLGKIATLLDQTEENVTPLQKSLDIFGKRLTLGIVVLCVLIFGIYVYHGNTVLDSLLLAVALAVAAIPESLNPIITIVLSLETEKLAKENAIVKELKSIEALGSISVICSDKTGTLTQNKMTVKKIFINGKLDNEYSLNIDKKVDKLLLDSFILCTDATDTIGDPTETALIHLTQKYNMSFRDERKDSKRISEIPFDSVRKLMTVLYEDKKGKYIVFTKGAFDSLVTRFKYFIDENGDIQNINEDFIKKIEKINNDLAEEGLRVLTFAYKYIDEAKDLTTEDENSYIFHALVGMIDPPREESKVAVQECIRGGIKPVMITGDHKLGKICAMTGDGVNDAPALKKANIGIAMGITGTEVSKNAASMILADDNFSTIVKAIITGRNVYRNIKNAIGFLLSGNTAAILAVLYSSLANLPVIFSPVQLLFINLLTDSLPSIAVGVEPKNEDILDEKPRDPNEAILTKRFSSKLVIEGVLIAIFIIIAFYIGLKESALKGSTMAFATLCLARLFHGIDYRGQRNVFAIGFFKNKFSLIAFALGFVLLNLVLLIPAVYEVFGITKIEPVNFLQIYVLSLIPTVLVQIYKAIKYR